MRPPHVWLFLSPPTLTRYADMTLLLLFYYIPMLFARVILFFLTGEGGAVGMQSGLPYGKAPAAPACIRYRRCIRTNAVHRRSRFPCFIASRTEAHDGLLSVRTSFFPSYAGRGSEPLPLSAPACRPRPQAEARAISRDGSLPPARKVRRL